MKSTIKFFLCLSFLTIFSFSIIEAQSVKKQKVILDFDIGDDFDDANALALLLASPEIELLGVVVDYGDTPKRAKLACRMLYEVGREDIPVIVGRQMHDEYTLNFEFTDQYTWGKGFDKVKPINMSASDFISGQLRKYPNEVILITIGPVTNMGDLVDKDPDVLKLAKKVVAMFGSFYLGYGSNPVPCAEWNVFADIPASQKYSSCGANIVYVGLDVTTYVKLTEDIIQLLSYRNSPLTNSVLGLMAISNFERKVKEPIIYDAVTIGMVLWPELFETRQANVHVDDRGYTIIDESKKPNCEIATQFKMEEYLEKYTQRMLMQNLMRK